MNQVLFSPFHYRRELLDTCDRLGVVLESYSPLEQGSALDDPTVVAIARRIERTPAQVLLRWGVQKNTIVIPKSSRRERIVENAQIFDFELGDRGHARARRARPHRRDRARTLDRPAPMRVMRPSAVPACFRL